MITSILWAHDHLEKCSLHLIFNNNTPRFGDELWCGKPLICQPMYCKSIPYQVVTTVALHFMATFGLVRLPNPLAIPGGTQRHRRDTETQGHKDTNPLAFPKAREPDNLTILGLEEAAQENNNETQSLYFCNSSWDSQHNQYLKCSEVKNSPGCFLEFLPLLISFSPLTAFVFEARVWNLESQTFRIYCGHSVQSAVVSVSGNRKSCF